MVGEEGTAPSCALSHKCAAAYEGTLAAENASNGAGEKVGLRAVPTAIFASPHIATVAPTGARARAGGGFAKKGKPPVDKYDNLL